MAADKSYAKLGLFVVVCLAVMLATGLFFAQRMRSRTVIDMVTYTRENVSGLDVASPVRYRGVAVGRVSGIRVDPDADTIEVSFELFHDRLASIGADVRRVERLADLPIARHLRAQVIGNPITGESYLLLDAPKDPPPPMPLKFTPSRAYVPSMPSPMATVRDRLPDVLERAEATLQTLREIVSRVPGSLDRSDRFFTNVERVVRESEFPQLSADARAFFAGTTVRMDQIRADVDRLMGAEGALLKAAEEARTALREADIAGSSQSARAAAERASLAADDLRRTLPAVRETLDQLRELARHIDEQPESVVYGPRKPGAQPQ